MRKRTGLFGVLLLASAAAYGCSDATAPRLEALDEAALHRGPPQQVSGEAAIHRGPPQQVSDTVAVVQRSQPLEQDIVVTERIGRTGGRIVIREAGLTVTFPNGALPLSGPRDYVEITVTAVAGDRVAYEFEPHGLQFQVPVKLEQDAKHTNVDWRGPGGPPAGQTADAATGAYFADRSALQADGTAVVSEYQETEAASQMNGSKFRWNIEHFSGYLLASNRGSLR